MAMISLNSCAGPDRTRCDRDTIGASNMRFATAVPNRPPVTWAAMYAGTSRPGSAPLRRAASVTIGLKWAPEIGLNVRIRATSAAPVAAVFARRASPTLPPAKRSPMMPEPTTAATRSPVPRPSATTRRARVGGTSRTPRDATGSITRHRKTCARPHRCSRHSRPKSTTRWSVEYYSSLRRHGEARAKRNRD